MLYYIILYYIIILYCIILYCIILYYIVLYYIVLYCIILYYIHIHIIIFIYHIIIGFYIGTAHVGRPENRGFSTGKEHAAKSWLGNCQWRRGGSSNIFYADLPWNLMLCRCESEKPLFLGYFFQSVWHFPTTHRLFFVAKHSPQAIQNAPLQDTRQAAGFSMFQRWEIGENAHALFPSFFLQNSWSLAPELLVTLGA